MNNTVLENTMVWIEYYRRAHSNTKPYMENPHLVKIIESPPANQEDTKVAWTDWFKRIHVRGYLFSTLDDNLRFQALAHELVHISQYRRFKGLGMLWYRSFGRKFAEEEAEAMGIMAENWIVKERSKELDSLGPKTVELEVIE